LNNPLSSLIEKLKDFLLKDQIIVETIKVDGRYRRFDGPKEIKIEGEILGKVTNKIYSPWRQGTSYVLTVPFSESIERRYEAYDILEKDGRRTLVFRELLEKEEEVKSRC